MIGRERLFTTFAFVLVLRFSIYLLAIYISTKFDLAKLLPFIPQESVNINIALYMVIFSTVLEYSISFVKQKFINLDVLITTSKKEIKNLPRTITLQGNKPRKLYLQVDLSGQVKTNGYLKVTFPKGITVAKYDMKTTVEQPENVITYHFSELEGGKGKTVFEFNVLKSTLLIEYSKIITCEMICEGNFFKHFINFSSNEIGIETEK